MSGRPTKPRSGDLVMRAPVRAIEDRSLTARVVATHGLESVSGGSALLRVGHDRLLAVHDDAFRVSLIALPSLAVTPLVLQGEGAELPKAEKPDFEAAVTTDGRAVHLLGSGSTAKRCKIARIDLESSMVSLLEHPTLYACVERVLASGQRPNIEGAVVIGERLRLFNRAAGRSPNASIDVPVAAICGEAPDVLAVQTFELGLLDGVALGFTDAAALADGRIAFVAAAEDAPDAIADGPVTGSIVGVIETAARGATARWTRLVEAGDAACGRKVEGLTIDPDLRAAWLLTDSDDPVVSAALMRVELVGFA
jgi:hypothetical protein